jgi:hypothetical protein
MPPRKCAAAWLQASPLMITEPLRQDLVPHVFWVISLAGAFSPSLQEKEERKNYFPTIL